MNKYLAKMLSATAQCGVETAEKALLSASGAAKKEFAIAFIVQNLPIPAMLKPLAAKLLCHALDEAIELAVLTLKSQKYD